MLEIKKIENNDINRNKVTEIFIDAYYNLLSMFNKNKESLCKAFKNTFLLNHFYGAFIKDELVGIFALTDEKERCFKIEKKPFVKYFGLIKGTFAYMTLRKEFEHKINLQKNGYFIEAVATKTNYLKQGIATAMIKYAIENNNYLELDVADTNSTAFKIYEKLGFKIFKEIEVKYFKKMIGHNKRIYMNYDKEKNN
jgi:ribosomal protein S18 acetylase RimI-like enzyme